MTCRMLLSTVAPWRAADPQRRVPRARGPRRGRTVRRATRRRARAWSGSMRFGPRSTVSGVAVERRDATAHHEPPGSRRPEPGSPDDRAWCRSRRKDGLRRRPRVRYRAAGVSGQPACLVRPGTSSSGPEIGEPFEHHSRTASGAGGSPAGGSLESAPVAVHRGERRGLGNSGGGAATFVLDPEVVVRRNHVTGARPSLADGPSRSARRRNPLPAASTIRCRDPRATSRAPRLPAGADAPSAPSRCGKRSQQVRRWLERRGRRTVRPPSPAQLCVRLDAGGSGPGWKDLEDLHTRGSPGSGQTRAVRPPRPPGEHPEAHHRMSHPTSTARDRSYAAPTTR